MVILLLLLLGLVLGSFINALVWRLHERKDWVRGRSECTHCHHKLGMADLIPVLSWVLLREKCRYCHHTIEDNPIAELLTPLLFIVSYLFWPISLHGFGLLQFCFWLVFVVGFVALALYDMRWYLLPNRIIFPLLVLSSLEVIIHIIIFKGGWQDIALVFWGVAISSGLFFILFQLSKGEWIGGGDVKLGILLGILLGGPARSLLLLFISSLMGSLVSVPLLVKGKVKRNTLIPYGPFLLASAFIIMIFGDQIIHWFNSLVLG